MLLKEKINKDIIDAIKSKENSKRDVLRVLKGEIERSETKTDGEIVSLVKKMIENIQSTTNDTQEINILTAYLPRQLNESEISNIIKEQIHINGYSSPKDMGVLMNFFKTHHNGQYDGKIVSDLVRGELMQ